MSEKRKNKTGRNPKLDPAVHRYTVRFNEEEHNRFPRHVRQVGRLRQVCFHQGALLRAVFQSAESGQNAGGLLHQTVRFPCAIPRDRHELQPSREGTALPFLREKGDGVALQAGATDRGTREIEP